MKISCRSTAACVSQHQVLRHDIGPGLRYDYWPDCLSHKSLDHTAIVGPDGARRLRHVNNGELLLRIDPEKSAAIAGPHILAFGAGHACEPRPLPNHEAQSECVALYAHQKGARCERI